MNKYKNLHWWLFIPFVIVMLGFANSYWLKFFDAPWRQHLHGLTATLWFVILIAQPYLITRGNVKQHKFYGMLALFAAGGVVFSGLAAIPFNLSSSMPDMAKYGLSFLDLVLITGFTYAVYMAIKNVHKLHDHASWMISTVFWALGPGLSRFLWSSFDWFLGDKAPPRFVAIPMTGAIIITIILGLMLKNRQVHRAYILAIIGVCVFFFVPIVGKATWWINIANSLFSV